MDSLIVAAARALAGGDTLGALKRVALRGDPPALALRGVAMARLGEHGRARELLREAARGFGRHEALACARCVVAEAEIALAQRELAPSTELAAAGATLQAAGDKVNALQARLIALRRLLLLGRLDEAEAALGTLDTGGAAADASAPSDLHVPPALAAVAALGAAELALRRLRIGAAQEAIARAQAAAEASRLPELIAEVAQARSALDDPAARCLREGDEHALRLGEVAALLESGAVVLDACRRGLRAGAAWVPLARRPVLFALALVLARSWPQEAGRRELIEVAFRTRHPDETHRARLRVEIGRLRLLVAGLVGIEATSAGFTLRPRGGQQIAVLLPPVEGDPDALLALLSDGAAWSTSSLALALGASQRSVQRALADLEAAGRVRSLGRARAQRWLAPPLAGFTTILLLPASLPPA
ncbi:helix-turn-helix domain-containing protein [Ramlibacter rhizophilus]|uniref:Helix-turn-helix domain-containing protein n=1 Tax=Ramlibacter rhizophilus TaxID=1781167 RepID=A0A4Z0BR46_9BURK|nr:helix-turn-helix domain-containing protein [Ramlibacter rhizophilus]TFZ01242.1 helix-turn-helix domain-containing protein [Ramlibacter rhizophilus]